MQEHRSALSNQAFGEHADEGLIVAYQSHQDALRFLSSTLSQPNGVAVLQGPHGSGKTTVVREQLSWSSRDAAVAFFDGLHLTPRQLLTGMLAQYDVKTTSEQDEHLLQLLNKFLSQKAAEGGAAILIIDNVDRATASAMRLLNWLSALELRGKFALRIILTTKPMATAMSAGDSMRSLARRHPATYTLNPLSVREAAIYLRTRLIAAGGEHSEKIFPIDVCENLHKLSNGWPGELNRLAMESMDRRDELASTRVFPRIIVSRDGKSVGEYELTDRQYVIGRTGLADIVVEDSYVSKMHAMLQVYSNAILLIDLNSTNGTTVNSKVVQKTVLRSDDIISMGRYRLKVESAPGIDESMEERIQSSDTVTMQNLVDLRRERARRTIKALKHR